MRTLSSSSRPSPSTPLTLNEQLKLRIRGQDNAIDAITPSIDVFQAGLGPDQLPLGSFLLLGPTGTGKSYLAESLAWCLHGSSRAYLRIDCGEYQMDHEVAKLIGAPPGYLGHRETTPALSQAKVNAVTSDRSSVSIILFDEIEKAAPSFHRLLLGILDRATLRLGDSNIVNFERTLILLSSNLGAREIQKALKPSLGFNSGIVNPTATYESIQRVAVHHAKKKLAPEFMNRMDACIVYMPLSEAHAREILDLELEKFQAFVQARWGALAAGFELRMSDNAKEFLLKKGFSEEYGARPLKRAIRKYLIEPLALKYKDQQKVESDTIHVDVNAEGTALAISGEKMGLFEKAAKTMRIGR